MHWLLKNRPKHLGANVFWTHNPISSWNNIVNDKNKAIIVVSIVNDKPGHIYHSHYRGMWLRKESGLIIRPAHLIKRGWNWWMKLHVFLFLSGLAPMPFYFSWPIFPGYRGILSGGIWGIFGFFFFPSRGLNAAQSPMMRRAHLSSQTLLFKFVFILH